MKTIDYYYSTRSNFTLLGASRLIALARKYNRRILHRPILLSETMKPLKATPFDDMCLVVIERTCNSKQVASATTETVGEDVFETIL